MLGPIGASVMKMLKVLTPQDILDLTKSADQNKNKVKAKTDVEINSNDSEEKNLVFAQHKKGQHEQAKENEHRAPKIIPLFVTEEEEEQVVYKKAAGSSYTTEEISKISSSQNTTKKESELESIGVLSQDKIQELEEQRKIEAKKKEPSATIFLLGQREKLRNSNCKIYGQTAIKSYKSSAILDIQIEEKLEEEGKANVMSGILLDKKQF